MASSLIGQTLGKYRIVSLIGHGGMATVFKAHQADIDRNVAIKVLPPHPGRDQHYVDRFQLEARTIAKLQHPHILPLYEYGVQDDIIYLVMALVEGGSLTDRIRRGPMPAQDVDRLLHQIASALDYAHRQGVVHRDIKPDNILIDSEGFPLLADFGIAKLVQDDAKLTATGSMVGTPAYMSPEQGQGLPAGSRSDIYSLGVVVYEMLTGHQPFDAETAMQIVLKHLNEPLPLVQQYVSGLPLTVDEVLRCAMAKRPENRYPSAVAFAEDFSRAVRGSTPLLGQGGSGTSTTLQFDEPLAPGAQTTSTTTMAASSTQPTVVTVSSSNQAVQIAGLAVIVLLVGAVLILALRGPSPTPATQTPPTEQQIAQAPTATSAPPTDAPAIATSLPTFGEVRFSTVSALGDTVSVQVENLVPPAQGNTYAAWLVGADGATLPLGALRLDSLGNGVLSYTDGEGRTLPSLYNVLLLTQEESVGDTPGGDPVYSGSVPAAVASALSEIFVASEQGIDGGSLMDGLMSEASIGRQHSGLAASATNVGGMHTHAEHTTNILLGTTDDLDGSGSGQNPGRGIGVRAFLDRIETQLDAIANVPDASRALQSQIELMRVCTLNTRHRMEQIITLERALLDADSVESVSEQAAESTAIADQMVVGHDLNSNGRIEPFEGECGIEQIPDFGVVAANMDILEGALPSGETA